MKKNEPERQLSIGQHGYRLKKIIGEGQFGKVFTCIRIQDNKEFAIKIANIGSDKEFRRVAE